MASDRTSDEQIAEALVFGVVRNRVEEVITPGQVSSLPLPEARPLSNVRDEMLVEELAHTIRIIGDQLERETSFNDMIDGLGYVADKGTFNQLVRMVFSDGKIEWGRIVVLVYSVGKLAAKMVLAKMPKVIQEILSLTMEFFRRRLLDWIHNMGGWISSVSAVAQFSIDRFSSSFSISPSVGLIIVFASGVLVGACIAWKIHRST